MGLFTHTITATTFTIPKGCTQIDIMNSGSASGTILGTETKSGQASSAVPIQAGQPLCLLQRNGFKDDTVLDATNTVFSIIVTY